MSPARTDDLETLAEAFAFLGNSLLTPMNQTPKVGLDPAFWTAFPDFGSGDVRDALVACAAFADACAQDPIMAEREVAAEYARLFIGPPRPTAPPWESAYVDGPDGIGFGAPTFEMRAQLRDAGLRVENENNQYEDHMGIELLLLSVLLERVAEGQEALAEVARFARVHPGNWMAPLRERIVADSPNGYYSNLTALAESLLDFVSIAL